MVPVIDQTKPIAFKPQKAKVVSKNPMVVEILMPSKEEYAEMDRRRKVKSVVIPPVKVGDFIINSLKDRK